MPREFVDITFTPGKCKNMFDTSYCAPCVTHVWHLERANQGSHTRRPSTHTKWLQISPVLFAEQRCFSWLELVSATFLEDIQRDRGVKVVVLYRIPSLYLDPLWNVDATTHIPGMWAVRSGSDLGLQRCVAFLKVTVISVHLHSYLFTSEEQYTLIAHNLTRG